MAFNGSGVFERLYNWVADRDAGTKIRADRMDNEMDGMATGLSNCITKDGQTTITADIPMSSQKLTGLSAGSAAGHSVRFEQVLKYAAASIASASTLPVTALATIFNVTGTTTITAFANVGVGTLVFIRFDGALTLTHHATDLILPGGANITTVAGDFAAFYEYSTGDWRCMWYQRTASGPVTGAVVGTTDTQVLTNKTIDAANNTLSLTTDSVDAITEIAAALKSGADLILITGTAGTNGNLSQWNGDGDLIDGPTPPSGAIVGTTDTQALTNKDISGASNTYRGATTTATGAIERATVAEVRDPSTDEKYACVKDLYDAAAEVALTSTSNSVAWDMDTGIDFDIDTLGENTTIANPTNVTVGKKGRLRIVQDATGSRTVAWGTNFEFASGSAPTATTDANAEDLFYYDCISATRILITSVLDVS